MCFAIGASLTVFAHFTMKGYPFVWVAFGVLWNIQFANTRFLVGVILLFLHRVSQAGEKLQSVGSNIEFVGKKMSIASTAIVGVGATSANMAMDFEDAMAKVNTIRVAA